MHLNAVTHLHRIWVATALWLCAATAPAQQPPRLDLCVACHGPQGNSTQPNIPSLAGQPRIFLENQLVLIREGLRDIPPMKGLLDGLNDPDLIALAQYFSAQRPAPMAGAVDAPRYARGQTLANNLLCGSCHLPSYMGREQIPRLAAQHAPFLRAVMEEYRDRPGSGRDTVMTNALRGVSNAQLDDLAHFLAHFGQQP